MLPDRLSDPRWIASLHDPGLRQIERPKLKKYQLTRDIKDLGDLDALDSPPTLCLIHPMKPKWAHLLAYPERFFGLHCSAIKNAPFGDSAFEENDGWVSMKKEFVERMPFNDVVDFCGAINEMASVNGVDSPFSSQDTTWEDRTRDAQTLAVMVAAMGIPVKPPHSKPSDTTKSSQETKPEPTGPPPPSPSETGAS